MKRIVIDIETVGIPQDEFEPGVAREIDRWASASDDHELVYDQLALNALTGRVVAIGMMNMQSGNGRVHFQPADATRASSSDGLAELIPGTEPELLRAFWDVAAKADQLVTFNGRGFDMPFIIYRSAALRITPTVNLMPNRYTGEQHIDLMDRLSFFRAVRSYSLEFFCLLMGIENPKQGVISTTSVAGLWADGRYQDIADYCWSDVKATAELFRLWARYVTHPPVSLEK